MWGLLAGSHGSEPALRQRRQGRMAMVFLAIIIFCGATLILVDPPVFGPIIGAFVVLSILGALGQGRGAFRH